MSMRFNNYKGIFWYEHNNELEVKRAEILINPELKMYHNSHFFNYEEDGFIEKQCDKIIAEAQVMGIDYKFPLKKHYPTNLKDKELHLIMLAKINTCPLIDIIHAALEIGIIHITKNDGFIE